MRWASSLLLFVLVAVPQLLAQTSDVAIATNLVLGLPNLRPGALNSTNLSFRELDILLSPELRLTREHVIQTQAEKAAADFLAQGDAAQAVEAYQGLDDELQAKPANQCGLALALMETEAYPQAVALFDTLIKAHPDQPVFLNNLAWLYATASDVQFRNAEKSLNLSRRALQLAPRDPRIWHTLSEAYYVNEEYHEAVKRVRQSIALANVAPFQELLPEFEAQLKKCENAARILPLFQP